MSKRTGTTRQSSTTRHPLNTTNTEPEQKPEPSPAEQAQQAQQAHAEQAGSDKPADKPDPGSFGLCSGVNAKPEPDSDTATLDAMRVVRTAWERAIAASIEAAPTYVLPDEPREALKVALVALKRSDRDDVVIALRAADSDRATTSTPPDGDLMFASSKVGTFADTVRQAPKHAGSTRTPRVIDVVGDTLAVLVTMSMARQQVLSNLTPGQVTAVTDAERAVLNGTLPVGATFGPTWPTYARRGTKQTGGSTGTRAAHGVADADKLPADLADLAGADLFHRTRDGGVIRATVNADGTRVVLADGTEHAALSPAAIAAGGGDSVNGRTWWKLDAPATATAAA